MGWPLLILATLAGAGFRLAASPACPAGPPVDGLLALALH
jgi:hypothetical protein